MNAVGLDGRGGARWLVRRPGPPGEGDSHRDTIIIHNDRKEVEHIMTTQHHSGTAHAVFLSQVKTFSNWRVSVCPPKAMANTALTCAMTAHHADLASIMPLTAVVMHRTVLILWFILSQAAILPAVVLMVGRYCVKPRHPSTLSSDDWERLADMLRSHIA